MSAADEAQTLSAARPGPWFVDAFEYGGRRRVVRFKVGDDLVATAIELLGAAAGETLPLALLVDTARRFCAEHRGLIAEAIRLRDSGTDRERIEALAQRIAATPSRPHGEPA